MTAVALALAASACWGLSDFLAGLKARSLPLLGVLAMVVPGGLPLLAGAVAIRGAGPPRGVFLLYAALAGAAGGLGVACLYRGLAIGAMGIVAPITATAPLIPLAVGLARGERPSSLQGGGIALALTGIVLAAREPTTGERRSRVAAGAALAAVGAGAFGIALTALDAASNRDPYWSALGSRSATAVLVLGFVLARRPPIPTRAVLPALLLAGSLDAGATALFAVSTTKGLVSIVAVLASLYPVVIAVLARLVLHERLGGLQRLGAGTALAGAALISAG